MLRYLLIGACVAVLAACNPAPESARGFRLPDGNAQAGLRTFKALECHACHDVPDVEPPAESAIDTRVVLGGEVTRVRTYGDLVTSIINPSHKLAPGYRPDDVTTEGGRSLMEGAYLNEIMTVQELIDLVAYLQPLYEVRPPDYNPYSYMYR
jgi:hypothetical protein